MADNITQAVISIAGKLDPSVKKSAEKATQSISKLKVAAIAGAAAIGAAAVAGAKKLLDLGSEFDGAYDTIRIGTGATGEALEGLKGDFEKVFSALPTSAESASTAIADFNTRLGLSGDDLQTLSKQAIYLSENLGAGNLQGIIEKTSQAFQGFGIDQDQMSSKMDYLFKVSQSTGIGYEDLAGKVQQYSKTFLDLGYSFDESAALIGQLEKAGINTDQVLAGLKTSIGKLTAGGKTAAEGFEEYYYNIKNAANATDAANIAAEIFGTKNGAQMARAIREGSLACGALVSELTNSSETIEGASMDTMDFAEKMQILKNKMKVSLAPLGNSVFDSINALMPLAEKGIEALTGIIQKLAKHIPEIAPKIAGVVTSVINVLSKVSPIVSGIVSVIGAGMGGAFDALGKTIGFVSENFERFLPLIAGITAAMVAYKAITSASSIATKLHTAFTTAQTAVTTALTAAQAGLTTVMNANPIGLICIAIGALVAAGVALYKNWDTVKEKCAALWASMTAVFSAIGAKISEIFTNVKSAIAGAITSIGEKFPLIGVYFDVVKNQIQSIVEGIKGVFNGVIDFVKNVFTGNWQGAWQGVKDIFSSVFNGLAGIVKAPLNGIIGIVNKVIGSINGVGFTIPEWVPIVGGKSFSLNIPQIPMFAQGGIATGPSIVGEGGWPEYVLTTDPQYRARNIDLLGQAADALGATSTQIYNTSNTNTRTGGQIKIEFAPVISCAGGNAEDILQAIRARLPEFVDMIQGAIMGEMEGAY